jgi:hypothetical protein
MKMFTQVKSLGFQLQPFVLQLILFGTPLPDILATIRLSTPGISIVPALQGVVVSARGTDSCALTVKQGR